MFSLLYFVCTSMLCPPDMYAVSLLLFVCTVCCVSDCICFMLYFVCSSMLCL